MVDHISAADLNLDQVDLKLGITLLDAGALFGDLIVVSSKNVNDIIMAFCEFYGEDPFYHFHSDKCFFHRAPSSACTYIALSSGNTELE